MSDRPPRTHSTVSGAVPSAAGWIGNLFRYCWVGIGINLSCYLTFFCLVTAGLPPKIVVSVLYVVGIAVGYVVHRSVSFRSRARHRVSIPGYLGAHVVGFATNLGLIVVLSDGLGWDVRLVQLVAIGVVAAELFVLMQVVAFRPEMTELNGD